MPSKTRSYRSWQEEKLADPSLSANYLNAAMKDSPEMFLKAVRNVAQARQVARVAKQAGVTRENLYRAFSEGGNPTFDTLLGVLGAMDLHFVVRPKGADAPALSAVVSATKTPRRKRHRAGELRKPKSAAR
jgi:probable addiction module antidote protein